MSHIEANSSLSILRQCQLLDIPRSSYYYQPVPESAYNLHLMLLMDKQYLLTPTYGSRMMCAHLCGQGHGVNRKRVQRLMRLMGLEAIFCKPRLSDPDKEHQIYPYLLRNVAVTSVNHVWSTDITYIPMQRGFLYLTAVIDWYSRFVLSWQLSNSMESSFCIEALEVALARYGTPQIFNTDQGSQFTSNDFTSVLKKKQIQISMDGKGRATDNAFIERLWRTVKYEHVYLHAASDGEELYDGLRQFFEHYNYHRPHSSLGYRTPASVYQKLELNLSTNPTASSFLKLQP